MLWQPLWEKEAPAAARSRWLEPVAGGALGFLAGVVGIGGGIFLAPLLYMLRWGPPKAIAGTCAVFILANSLSGLAGQLAKGSGGAGGQALATYWPLFPAVLVGGLIGSTLGSGRLEPQICPHPHRFAHFICGGQAGDPLLWRDYGSRRMIDPFGRTISYLRLSVTDRCDLRCTYCMPERMAFLPRAELLGLGELDRLAAAFIRKGVRKLRLTGGEPLVRKDVIDSGRGPVALPALGRSSTS